MVQNYQASDHDHWPVFISGKGGDNYVDNQIIQETVDKILSVLPNQAGQLARLVRLMQFACDPTITVIGKYNHGKSRLLNELIGTDIFSVADKRETIQLAEHKQDQVRWLDAPGLDADVAAVDDRHAFEAVWTQADIRLFVHSVREGELDATEHHLLQQLIEDANHSRRQTILVLTQIDQIPDQTILTQIETSIAQQVPKLDIWAVSATRHRQGIENGKTLLIEKSGIGALRHTLEQALAQVPSARAYEKNRLLSGLHHQLNQLLLDQKRVLQQLQQTQQQQLHDFDTGLINILDKIRVDLEPIVNIDGQDQALNPDSFATMFKNTAAKQQRAKVQIAYSRACIEINSHLIRHGVVGLPAEQQTTIKSIDTVIVAVFGISVKFRDQLRALFYTDIERQRLQRELRFYFEKSAGRVALAAKIEQTMRQQGCVQNAMMALQQMESAA